MRISQEVIHQTLFIEGRGARKRELVACRRTGRALRMPRVDAVIQELHALAVTR